MREVCDLSYTIQVEQIERQALTQMTLAPHVEDSSKIAPPAEAVREFQQWLVHDPDNSGIEPEDAELIALLGVRG